MATGASLPIRHDRLRRARLERGLSRDELAKETGCSVSAIGYYEAGERTPRIGALRRIAEALDRPIAWFLPEEETNA